MAIIEESDMRFGEYPDENVFYIEKCSQYKIHLRPNGVKSCEFIFKRDNSLYFVEAKTSCPNQITAGSPAEKKMKYNQYLSDIILKMRHSLTLYANILLKQYSDDQVPDPLLNQDLSQTELKLVLVVKNAEKDWLSPLSDALNSTFANELRIWKIKRIYVINEETARQKHFVI